MVLGLFLTPTTSLFAKSYNMYPTGNWYYSDKWEQGSGTYAFARLTNNDPTASGHGYVELRHIQTGPDHTYCANNEYLSAGGDYTECSKNSSELKGDTLQSRGKYTTISSGEKYLKSTIE